MLPIPPPTQPEHSPHAWQKPKYGAKTRLTTAPIDESAPLDPMDKKQVQEIKGCLLYHAHAIASTTLLVALGTLAVAQTKGTQATAKACTQLLNHCATYPDATIRFIASDMILHSHSDTLYLSKRSACPKRKLAHA